MKNREISFTKRVRFQIILYSLVSLLLTILSEGILAFVFKQLGIFGEYLQMDFSFHIGGKNELAESSLNNSWSIAPNQELKSNFQGRSNNLIGNGEYWSEPFLAESFFEIGPERVHFWIFLSITLFVGIVFFIIYFLLFSRRMAVSLEKISAGVEHMAAGDLSARVEIDGNDEFAFLASRLNAMAEDISFLIENERKSERMKNNLITNVAHDLRTPLTSIIGYLDLLVKNPDLEELTKEKYMKIAYDKALRLQKLIEDLFSYTKVSQGEVEPELMPLNIVTFMEQMVDEFYPSFQEASLQYEFITNDSNIMIMADGDLLARAFSNLIGNAVKYGRDGKNIRIHIHKQEENVSICIVNYGKVIPEKDLEYIFDRFYRVESSRSEKTGGTGLGLAIAKRIIVMHGGTITADSGMEGTTFEVKLKAMENTSKN